jgi:ribosome biogenesis GTPase A
MNGPGGEQGGAKSAAHTGAKDDLVNALTQLAEIATGAGLTTLVRDIREVRIPKLSEERFSLVVLGEFNHGKSTFLNALLGDRLLPVGATPTTAALAEIRHGDRVTAEAVFESGRRQVVPREELDAWLSGKRGEEAVNGGARDALDRVEIQHPAPFLVDRITVVDTPGVNDLSAQRADITYGYVPRADAIVFLLDGTQVLTESERRFLQERILGQSRDRLIFVIAKADLLDEAERKEVEAFAREQLSAVVPDPPLFFVSAKRAIAGDVAGSGLPALTAELERVLGQDRRRVLLDHALGDAGRLSRFVRQSLAIRRASLALPEATLDAKVADARRRLFDGKKALGEAGDTIRAESAALKARVSQDLAAFAGNLRVSLEAELPRAQAADVEKYMAGFLEDTYRAWVLSEGRMVAAELERLAERIVAVAAEKLDAVTREVARDLAGLEEPIAAPWTGLEYEAGVLALGALGTTALLFVNAMMGGAVALLTPALASLARSRAAAAAKEEARKQMPEILARMSAECGTRMAGVIDEFAARLEAFITEAGAALARGIAEVLEGAQRARRENEQPGSPAEAAIVEGLARLKKVDERIAEIRQALWET